LLHIYRLLELGAKTADPSAAKQAWHAYPEHHIYSAQYIAFAKKLVIVLGNMNVHHLSKSYKILRGWGNLNTLILNFYSNMIYIFSKTSLFIVAMVLKQVFLH